MISTSRMKIDLIGQIVLILAICLQLVLLSHKEWTNLLLFILVFWQLLSAYHLLSAYKYVKKINFIRVGIVLVASLPVWIYLLGAFAYLPVIGLVIWYFWETLRDTIIVLNRPKSFWDLF